MSTNRVCPVCGSPSLHGLESGGFECNACGISFLIAIRDCPSCGHPNKPEADECSRCGEPLSISSQIIQRHTGVGEPHWLRRTRAQAEAIKQSEHEASRSRMEVLSEVDKRRLEAEAHAIAEQKARDARILISALVLFGSVLLAVLLIAIFLLLTGS